MTLFKNFIGLIALTTLFFSCQKEMSVEDVKSPVVIDANWEFTESGKRFSGKIDTAYITELTGGYKAINIEGTTEDGTTGQIVLGIAAEKLEKGVYSGDYVIFLYGESSGTVFNSGLTGAAFSITISSIDSSFVSGTFAGTVKDENGNDKTIVDGKFSAPIGKDDFEIIQPNPDSEDYFQLGSRWEYQNANDANDKVVISYFGDTTINVDGAGQYNYAIFENSRTGQHKYYRKDGSNFYEYSLLTFGGNQNPTEIDLLILKQDEPAYGGWESDPYGFSLSGVSLQAKIVSTVEGKDCSSVLDGIKYENLMHVSQQLYLEFNGSFDPTEDNILDIIYSKGIGIVQFYDPTLDGTYVLKSYTP